jgi:hypothetical protein
MSRKIIHGKMRKALNVSASLSILGFIAYNLYVFGGAETRMRKLCAEITPGMSFASLTSLSLQRGVRVPRTDSGLVILVETKSFGRWGCEVVLENGVVKRSDYHFAD